VYKVKEKDGKVYAVKKSKRQFRSKKDRALFMGEADQGMAGRWVFFRAIGFG
jgi:hypothetical protein